MRSALEHNNEGLRERFLRCAIDPDHWERCLEDVAHATGSTRAQLIGVDRQGDVAFNVMTAVDESFMADFLQIAGHHTSSVNFRIASTAAPGELVWEKQYDAAQARIGDNAYSEACERHHLPFGCQTSLAIEEGAFVGFALLRARKEGRTQPGVRAFFMEAAVAAQAALRLQRSIEEKGAAIAHGTLDLVNTPVVLIDAFGRVANMTASAERIIASHRAIDVKARVLVGQRSGDTALLAQKLRSVIDRHEPEASLLLQAPGVLPLRVTIHALPNVETGFNFSPRALVSLGDGGRRATPPELLLRQHYHLTAAECEIVAMLAQGTRRVEIADRRGTSLGTVQQQIKSIFAKTGVGREGELLALVAAV